MCSTKNLLYLFSIESFKRAKDDPAGKSSLNVTESKLIRVSPVSRAEDKVNVIDLYL